MPKFICWFSEIGKEDVVEVGGKGANLGEMAGIGMPVPPGFVVTASAYKLFLEKNNLRQKIKNILAEADVNRPTELEQASKEIKRLIVGSPVPEELATTIVDSYTQLGRKIKKTRSRLSQVFGFLSGDPLVAVRSSATSEDSKEASFAGQNETYLNVHGEANLVEAVRRGWASLFEGRSIFYRVQNHFDHMESYIAEVVQVMVPSEVSGIVFSIDPVTNNKSRVVIEAIWGLGEYIVQGKVTPDHYEVNKSDLYITEKRVIEQKIMLARDRVLDTKRKDVPVSKVSLPKLSDEQIKNIAELSIRLEKHYYFPQDSEFAVSDKEVFFVQTRPITTTKIGKVEEIGELQKNKQALSKLVEIVCGAPASPGIKSGPARVLRSAKEINKVKHGDILVAEQTNPDYVPAMKRAAAIVTDKGGRTSHAAIVSRELGIPCVVGTDRATKIIKSGEAISVNGAEGKVYRGGIRINTEITALPNKEIVANVASVSGDDTKLRTATKVYVNLAEPDVAKEIAAKDCDGIGLLRAEFMLAGIGMHPKEAIARGKQRDFINNLSSGLTAFAEAFYPRPVVYRTTDFKTNEYRSLKGGDKYEPNEANPMMGFRGAYRYIVQPEVFKMEVEAVKFVRNKTGFRNLWMMIPFCRTVEELVEVKKLLSDFGLHRSPSFKLWMMCEIPSNVILLDKFIEVGIDGISVGSNDLTMLTLGVDRDNEHVASEYNELDESLLWSFERIAKTCLKYKVSCSICGQAPSDYPDLTEKLVEYGITSISVSPDAVDRTRQIVYEAEKKLAKNSRK